MSCVNLKSLLNTQKTEPNQQLFADTEFTPNSHKEITRVIETSLSLSGPLAFEVHTKQFLAGIPPEHSWNDFTSGVDGKTLRHF